MPVLTDIHLNVRQGEFVSIAGPSGCGKTTLLSLMGLLDVPTHGELQFHGVSVDGLGGRPRGPACAIAISASSSRRST